MSVQRRVERASRPAVLGACALLAALATRAAPAHAQRVRPVDAGRARDAGGVDAAGESAPAAPTARSSDGDAATAPGGEEREVLRRAVELRRQGREEEAYAVIRDAWARSHSANAAGQLALVEQALGRWLDAEAHLREALASETDPWVARNRDALRASYEVILERVGTLDLRGGVPGAEVRIDGARVGALPLAAPLRLLAGTVTLEVRAEGYYPYTRRVGIIGGQPTREQVTLRRRAPGEVDERTVRVRVAREPHTAMVIGGTVLATVGYLPALIVGLAGFAACGASATGSFCPAWTAVIPLGGPLVAAIGLSVGQTNALALGTIWGIASIDLVAQAAAFALLVVGIRGRPVRVVDPASDTAPARRRSLRRRPAPPRVWLAPGSATGAGFSLGGVF